MRAPLANKVKISGNFICKKTCGGFFSQVKYEVDWKYPGRPLYPQENTFSCQTALSTLPIASFHSTAQTHFPDSGGNKHLLWSSYFCLLGLMKQLWHNSISEGRHVVDSIALTEPILLVSSLYFGKTYGRLYFLPLPISKLFCTMQCLDFVVDTFVSTLLAHIYGHSYAEKV